VLPARAASDRPVFAQLRVSGELYALAACELREVLRYRAPTPLPGAPELIDGVVDLRGALIPVVDLARALGRLRPEARPKRIAVVEIRGHVLGLAAQDVLAVGAIDASQLEAPPAVAKPGGEELVCQLIRRSQAEPIPVLSLEALLARIARRGPQEVAA